jgi:hypothetical protein
VPDDIVKMLTRIHRYFLDDRPPKDKLSIPWQQNLTAHLSAIALKRELGLCRRARR